jgi:hypothetical protein
MTYELWDHNAEVKQRSADNNTRNMQQDLARNNRLLTQPQRRPVSNNVSASPEVNERQ